jgi:hypothetical protein
VPQSGSNCATVIRARLVNDPARIPECDFSQRNQVLGMAFGIAAVDNPRASLGYQGAEEGRAADVAHMLVEADRQPLGTSERLISAVGLQSRPPDPVVG